MVTYGSLSSTIVSRYNALRKYERLCDKHKLPVALRGALIEKVDSLIKTTGTDQAELKNKLEKWLKRKPKIPGIDWVTWLVVILKILDLLLPLIIEILED